MNYFDGSYIEWFEHEVGGVSRKDYLAKRINAVQTAARSGKIIAFTIGKGNNVDTDMDRGQLNSRKSSNMSFQERLTYALFLFLVCVEEHRLVYV